MVSTSVPDPASITKVSKPLPPVSVSLPRPPFRRLDPMLPVIALSRPLPVPSMAALPVRTRFSTWSERVWPTALSTVSVPSPEFSVTTSAALSTT